MSEPKPRKPAQKSVSKAAATRSSGARPRTRRSRAEAPAPGLGGRIDAVMEAAALAGFLETKTGRIAARVSTRLIDEAKRQTGIATDSELVAFALASLALEDNFPAVFRASRGLVDPDLELGF